jgi:hypothetical protein
LRSRTALYSATAIVAVCSVGWVTLRADDVPDERVNLPSNVGHLEDFAPPAFPGGERIRQRFASEEVNLAWSTTARSRLLEMIADSVTIGASFIEVECRTTLCRVQLFLPGEAQSRRPEDLAAPAREFGQALATMITSDAEFIVLSFYSGHNEHGTPAVLLYVARRRAAGRIGDTKVIASGGELADTKVKPS